MTLDFGEAQNLLTLMHHYRLYHLGPSGQIICGFDLTAADDESARAKAEQHSDGHEWELWRGNRLIQAAAVERRQA